MANLITLQGSDPIKGSRETINQNFIAVMSDFAGTSFPTENLAVGMKFYNTDEKKEYRLTALPNTWEEEKSASTWNEIEGKPTFAVVATSGSYNDLSNKPTIPSTDNFVQQSDVANEANKIPKFNAEGHLVLPSGAEIW